MVQIISEEISCVLTADVCNSMGCLTVGFNSDLVNSEELKKITIKLLDLKNGTMYLSEGDFVEIYTGLQCVGFSTDYNGNLTRLQILYNDRMKFDKSLV